MAPANNNFLPVLDTWRDYFDDPYEGLGTTYERVLLHGIFERIAAAVPIETVLETPSFGMTGVSGINSLWWAQQGRKVTLTDDHPQRLGLITDVWQSLGLPLETHLMPADQPHFADRRFDLVWNFAALWFVPDVARFAEKLRRLTRGAILICVPNREGIGFRLRKKYVRETPQIYLDSIDPQRIRTAFVRDGWRLADAGIFDIPPWPDIPMKKEDLLRKAGLGFLVRRHAADSSATPPETILDYFAGRAPRLATDILRFNFLENAPSFFQRIWGHHHYFLFMRDPRP